MQLAITDIHLTELASALDRLIVSAVHGGIDAAVSGISAWTGMIADFWFAAPNVFVLLATSSVAAFWLATADDPPVRLPAGVRRASAWASAVYLLVFLPPLPIGVALVYTAFTFDTDDVSRPSWMQRMHAALARLTRPGRFGT